MNIHTKQTQTRMHTHTHAPVHLHQQAPSLQGHQRPLESPHLRDAHPRAAGKHLRKCCLRLPGSAHRWACGHDTGTSGRVLRFCHCIYKVWIMCKLRSREREGAATTKLPANGTARSWAFLASNSFLNDVDTPQPYVPCQDERGDWGKGAQPVTLMASRGSQNSLGHRTLAVMQRSAHWALHSRWPPHVWGGVCGIALQEQEPHHHG